MLFRIFGGRVRASVSKAGQCSRRTSDGRRSVPGGRLAVGPREQLEILDRPVTEESKRRDCVGQALVLGHRRIEHGGAEVLQSCRATKSLKVL